MMLFGKSCRVRPKRRGLSGEHIQLCAEGARRKPNLSGKRTEMLIYTDCICSSPLGDCCFFINFR